MANGRLQIAGLSIPSLIKLPAAAALAVLYASQATAAEPPTLEELLSAVVRIKTYIAPEARTAEGLRRERAGSRIALDPHGLLPTTAQLIVQAHPADVTTHYRPPRPTHALPYA